MNLSIYTCNTEELYFLHLMFYPKIKPELRRYYAPEMPEVIFELNVSHWLVFVTFTRFSKPTFSMGIVQLWHVNGFEIPFRNWGQEVGVEL
jgi:hypothetical protein